MWKLPSRMALVPEEWTSGAGRCSGGLSEMGIWVSRVLYKLNNKMELLCKGIELNLAAPKRIPIKNLRNSIGDTKRRFSNEIDGLPGHSTPPSSKQLNLVECLFLKGKVHQSDCG